MSPSISLPPHDVPLSGGSPFPPIADYGFLSDCETCALVAPSGAIEWMCLPRFDGPSVFGALLDRDAGTFRLGPADHDADHVLLRTMRCVNGSVEVQLECDPIFDYGRRYAQWEYVGAGYTEATASAPGWPTKLTLTTDLRVGFEGSRVRALTTLHDGDTAFVALAFSEHPGPKTYAEASERLVRTADYWHQWLGHGTFPDHPWRQFLQRSACSWASRSRASRAPRSHATQHMTFDETKCFGSPRTSHMPRSGSRQ